MDEQDNLEALLAKARGGDRTALMGLLEHCGPRVRERIVPKIGGWLQAHLDADDVMQVTYLEVVLRLDRFTSGGVSGFIAWVTRLAENNLIDAVRSLEASKRPSPRKRVSQARRAGGESYLGLVEMLGATYTTPSRDAAKQEAKSFLEIALDKLPPDYAKVIRMYDLKGCPIEEVGEALGRSRGAVYMLRARAHERLREAIGTESQFFSYSP